ncbi:MAG: hypothetical protein ACOYLS_06195 [Polymorphobacter sp.]
MRMTAMLLVAAFLASPVMAQRQGAGLNIEEAAEHQVWIDEHARWNAEHMTASRRLIAIAESLKRHDSNFDAHGNALRAHTAANAGRDRAGAALAQARLRAEHEEARSAHHHLMADVDALAAVMAEKFAVEPN